MLFTDLYHRLVRSSRTTSLRRAFLSRRQFEREITRERIRASRRGIPFCVVSLSLEASSVSARSLEMQSTQLGRLLLRKLRVTDEKAMLSRTDFAAILVDTGHAGGRAVIARFSRLFAESNLRVRMELRVHDPASFDGPIPPATADSPRLSEWADPAPVETLTIAASHPRAAWAEPQARWAGRTAADERRAAPSFVDVDFSNSGCVDSQICEQPASALQPSDTVSSDGALVPVPLSSGGLKRAIDIVGAVSGLIFVGPLLLIAMAVIRLTSPGGAIFKQTREGHRGKPFTIYKLRTMTADAETSQQMLRELSHRDGPAFKMKFDPRVTKVGRFLRATCIDELPQLLNVLNGDMSLVGPRPLPWYESRACSQWQRRRLDVRPGLTCSWQIKKSSVGSFDEWMRLDLQYVDQGGLWTDTVLIYRTLSVALLGRGSH